MGQDVSVNTAKRTLDLLEHVGRYDGVTFSEVMEAMDMPKSTAHDYLQTLLTLGYLIESDGKYHLSTKFLDLGEQRRRDMAIYQAARPNIRKLARETGEHSSLMIEENGRGVLLDTAIGDEAVSLNVRPGQRLPLTTTAPGKAILAHLPDQRIEDILDKHGLPIATPNTIIDREDLFDELDSIEQRGYALDLEEHVEGIRSIGAPIVVRGTVVGAIGLGGPVRRFSDERLADEFPELLLEAANVIEVNYLHS
ncbi:IclR family transcriptional regulator [Halosolutus halophilus]|uniref:IclR family transcriptional regulator n=1 Tax=Halosolutus halophilus TaxID=1552990 RepID=UPI0022351E1D|nr:IclR family transcriptional regulator [Halosolutus halophilus]